MSRATQNIDNDNHNYKPSSAISILYQRGLYPIDDFKMTTRYGMKVLISTNPELTAYIDKIIQQLQGIPFSTTILHVNLQDWNDRMVEN